MLNRFTFQKRPFLTRPRKLALVRPKRSVALSARQPFSILPRKPAFRQTAGPEPGRLLRAVAQPDWPKRPGPASVRRSSASHLPCAAERSDRADTGIPGNYRPGGKTPALTLLSCKNSVPKAVPAGTVPERVFSAPASDQNIRAGRVGCGIRKQPDNGLRNLIRAPGPSQRRGRAKLPGPVGLAA